MLNQKIKELKARIGEQYVMFWDDKTTYKGCFCPVYHCYPELPKYPLPADWADNYEYGKSCIEKHFSKIDKKEARAGDILVTTLNKELHVALCIENKQIIHVDKRETMRISRQNIFEKLGMPVIFYRRKNVQ